MHVARGPTISRGVDTLMTVGGASEMLSQPRTLAALAGLGALGYGLVGIWRENERQASFGLAVAAGTLLVLALERKL